MKIAICFFGIMYGNGGKVGSLKDFRHCYPNLKRNIIDPLEDRGHTVEKYISTYKIHDEGVSKEIFEMVGVKDFVYSDQHKSTAFTTKQRAFELFRKIEADIIILCRSDMHFNNKLSNIDLTKFNFLFPEKDSWDNLQFVCDNFYIWPSTLTETVDKAINECYGAYRSLNVSQDTHGLYKKLINHINKNDIHFVSNVEEFSDVNSFYSICRTELPNRGGHLNNEVMERFYK